MVKRAISLSEESDDEAPAPKTTPLQPSPFSTAQLATAKRARNGPARVPRHMNAQGNTNPDGDEDHDRPSSDENQPQPRPAVRAAKPAKAQLPTATGAGIIKLIKTYKDAEIKPGPRLNLVLGPNGVLNSFLETGTSPPLLTAELCRAGTGKSSLVCAICVGLGGGTKLLGRADKLKEFIRRGQTEGWTEITLSGDAGRDFVIRREMRAITHGEKESVDSTWKINGVIRREKDVQELMTKFNIQLDNLCQFLPQDKVVEFARLNPAELLKATEKAIGDATMAQQHEDLIVKRGELGQGELNYKKRKEQLDQQKAKQAQQERDYERFQQRRNLEQEIEVIQSKTMYLDVKAKKEAFTAAQQKHREAKEELEQLQPKKGDPSLAVKKLQAEAERAKTDAKKANEAFRRFDRDSLKACDSLSAKDTELEEKMKEKNGLAKLAADREAKIASAQQQLVQVRAELEALPERLPADQEARVEELRQEGIQLQNQIQDVDAGLSDMDGKMRHNSNNLLQAQGRLQQIGDAKRQKLQKLKTKNLQQCYDWVNSNRSQFQGPVFGPLLMEIDVRTPAAAPYLEMAVAWNMWSAFIVSCGDDAKLLSSKLRSMDCPATVVSVEDETPAGNPDGPPQLYQRFGIVSTLDQEVIAPARVLRGLCNVAYLHTKYIGTQQTADMMDQLTAARLAEGRPPLRDVYTPSHHYSSSVSRYNRSAVSTAVQMIRQANMLGGGGAQQQAAANSAEGLQRIIAALEKTKSDLEADKAEQMRHREQLMQRLQAAGVEQQAINNAKRKLADDRRGKQQALQAISVRLEAAKRQGDPRDREPEINSDIQAIMGEVVTLCKSMARCYRKQVEAFQEAAAHELRGKEAEMHAAALEEARRAQQQRIRQLQERVGGLEAEVARRKEIFLLANDRLLNKLGLERVQLPPALQAAFNKLPDSTEELDALMQTKTQEKESIVVNNESVAREYEERRKNIQQEGAELAELEQQLAGQRGAMEALKAQWLPQLLAITDTINATFSENFMQIGCAGEVVLKQADGDDFANYAMEIRVKFRETEALQVLNAQRQSGGERSVSTILYLIALQDVTVTPFRVVDEINQGMDPINERKVFMLLVNASCRAGTPQCFLLTPKLLPDLPFTPSITVLNIFNGTQIDDEAVRQISNLPLYGNRLQVLEGRGEELEAAA